MRRVKGGKRLLGLGLMLSALFVVWVLVHSRGSTIGEMRTISEPDVAPIEGRHEGEVVSTEKMPMVIENEGSSASGGHGEFGEIDLRRESIRKEMFHAWQGYEQVGFGHDEISPESGTAMDSFGGFGASVLEAVDTLLVMDMNDQFAQARDFIAAVKWNTDVDVSFSELSSRHLSGLLSAFAMTGDDVFLDKAEELGALLLLAFGDEEDNRVVGKEGIPFGFPSSLVNFHSHVRSSPSGSVRLLSDVGACHFEFESLAYVSGMPNYAEHPNRVLQVLDLIEKKSLQGLVPVYIDTQESVFVDDFVSIGYAGASYYDALLKHWILTRRKDKELLRLYSEAVESMIDNLILISEPNRLTYLSGYRDGRATQEMDYRSCFVPGMLALGAMEMKGSVIVAKHLGLADKLVRTCVELHVRSPTGLPPDVVSFNDAVDDYEIVDPQYRLRPETVESLFLLFRATHDEWYREAAWDIFSSMQKHCRTPFGYSGIRDVRAVGEDVRWDDEMPSYFLAMTMKYLYLLYTDDLTFPLDSWVFSSSGHPVRVFDFE